MIGITMNYNQRYDYRIIFYNLMILLALFSFHSGSKLIIAEWQSTWSETQHDTTFSQFNYSELFWRQRRFPAYECGRVPTVPFMLWFSCHFKPPSVWTERYFFPLQFSVVLWPRLRWPSCTRLRSRWRVSVSPRFHNIYVVRLKSTRQWTWHI